LIAPGSRATAAESRVAAGIVAPDAAVVVEPLVAALELLFDELLHAVAVVTTVATTAIESRQDVDRTIDPFVSE
jgi:hypothetical protein